VVHAGAVLARIKSREAHTHSKDGYRGLSRVLYEIEYVVQKLDWMRKERIWPNGLRYLWTDAFGVVLYISLYRQLAEERWLHAAEALVTDVELVLGRSRGLRIGEAPDRDGQYFHYLAMWLFALARLGDVRPEYRERGIELARSIHPAFVIPQRGVIWKMNEELTAPYPGTGFGGDGRLRWLRRLPAPR
jgi:hypothetical protein